MAQSLARLHIHLVFSTKHREPALGDDVRESLHRYMAAVLADLGCPAALIDSVEDHVHILFELARTVTVSAAAEAVKKSSSRWIKGQGAAYAGFAWQGGYGALAVSAGDVPGVRASIADQRRHHRQASFVEEYRSTLADQGVDYDERYLFD